MNRKSTTQNQRNVTTVPKNAIPPHPTLVASFEGAGDAPPIRMAKELATITEPTKAQIAKAAMKGQGGPRTVGSGAAAFPRTGARSTGAGSLFKT